MIRHIILAWFLYLMVFFETKQVLASDLPTLELRNHIGWCTKDCETIRLLIYPDGSVYYHGDIVVKYKNKSKNAYKTIYGHRHSKISKWQLDDLANLYKSFDRKEVEKYGPAWDVGAWLIEFNEDGKSEKVNDLPYFVTMIKRVDRYVGLRKWMCFPRSHKLYNQCFINQFKW